MKHLRRDRLVPHPSPPRTDDEHVHLAGCVECRVRALLLASHLTEHAPQSPIAGPSMERVRRTITRWVQASGTPELRGGQFGTVEQAPDGLVWRHAALQASPQDLERAERIDALALPGVVPWQLQGRDVVSDWLPGTTLDEWRSTAELGDTVTTLRVLQDVAHTLSRLHQAGLSHGGIAADRVLVCQGRGFLLLAGLSSAEGPTEVHAFGELCHEQLPPTTTALLPPPGTPLHELGPALTTVGLDEAWHTATHAPDALEPNTVVDRFRVVGERGRGAMAVVYEVQHRLLGTRHAMKVVLGRSVMVRRRLVREGRLQARLGHPNLVPVTDLIDVFGEPALILPLIDGPSLAEALEHSTPDRIEALALFAGVVAGVSYAHDNGVVHRDLKPANVLLEPGPGGTLRPRVTDFGLAKALHGEMGDRLTKTDTHLGTLAYAAPEQLSDAASVDQRADLWALGCLLFELSTGTLPFIAPDGSRGPLDAATLTFPAPVHPDVPGMVRGLLQRDPAARTSLQTIRTTLDAMAPSQRSPGRLARSVLHRDRQRS